MKLTEDNIKMLFHGLGNDVASNVGVYNVDKERELLEKEDLVTKQILENQKIVDTMIEEWKVCDNRIKMLEFESTLKDFEISQDTFNQIASHYLDKKEVLQDVYMRITGKDIKEIS